MSAYITETRDPLHFVALDGPPDGGVTKRRAVGAAVFRGWLWHIAVQDHCGTVTARRRVFRTGAARRVLQRMAERQLAADAER